MSTKKPNLDKKTWENLWASLAELTNGISESDPIFADVCPKVEAADRAFQKGDVVGFTGALTAIKKLRQK